MRDLIVAASDISRSFAQGRTMIHAVRHASCAILPGEQIGLMGRSGSGKSTLLHLLGGLDQPDTGTISWPHLPEGSTLRPSHITDIFQGPSLLPALDVLDNVCLPLILAGADHTAAEDAALAMLERFGLGALARAQSEELSGGQAQRVSIARALVVRPALILADEPTGQLDRVTAANTIETLIAVAFEIGAALVVSTHDPGIAGRFSARWQMNDGVLDTGEMPIATSREDVRGTCTVVASPGAPESVPLQEDVS